MSTEHVAWGSIEQLHNCVRTLEHLATLGQPLPTLRYRAKVKLHGSNCAVQRTAEGIAMQSRSQMITTAADFHGFAAWATAHRSAFEKLPPGTVVFGEWCGPGVMKGTAISRVAEKQFVVFTIQRGDQFIVEPSELHALVPELRVLPWEGEPIVIDYGSRESLERAAAELNRRVEEVEREDPWVKREFGISGIGEGLVLYPEPFSMELMFKAKGEKHRTAAAKSAVAVDASVAASVTDFVEMMVTEARLQQGVEAVGGRDPKRTGAFLAWMAADVQKESVAELEASGLAWSQVDKAVQAAVRRWFLKVAI
ncbi:MAG TPA: RNA ligase family protein [Kofleriaceae bacterium]